MDIIEDTISSMNGQEYRTEMDNVDTERMKKEGVVVVFGGSDDLMEFRGAVDEEIGCFGGGTAYLTSKGLLVSECRDDDCPYFQKLQGKATTIEAVWDKDGIAWQYKTAIPHRTFDIMEDGEVYCRGIIFRLSDIKEE